MGLPSTINKRLRACLGCSLVKTQAQFREEGCENCPSLRIKENLDNVLECTTDKFTGVVGLIHPKTSWAAKWQHIDTFTPGMYAIISEGELPDNHIRALERAGRTYILRDTSFVI
ncbi:transcription elongation factor SPT4 [Nematocida sp. AWRm77]|nr:transcription elongation factor SPT4 [Nematocida sp. AWRm77]